MTIAYRAMCNGIRAVIGATVVAGFAALSWVNAFADAPQSDAERSTKSSSPGTRSGMTAMDSPAPVQLVSADALKAAPAAASLMAALAQIVPR